MIHNLSRLEVLKIQAQENEIEVKYATLPKYIKGLYYSDNAVTPLIALNKQCIEDTSEELCIMAEELGHHYTTAGNILDQSITENRKQELKARRWAVKKLIRIDHLIEAYNVGITLRYELADYLNVTEEFLNMAIEHFKSIYGQYHDTGEYIIYFEPLGILKKFKCSLDK